MFKQLSIFLATLLFSLSSHATLIDFTDSSWQAAIDGDTATIGDITLTASTGYLTFNADDNAGCLAGQPTNGLTCDGDGIGIYDDEIASKYQQQITIDFAQAVNISNIFLLDLFPNEGPDGEAEQAIINGEQYFGDNLLAGGFYATGFTAQGITQLIFSGNLDDFSDYAVAGIEVSAVPLPGAVVLFGTALLGFFGVNAGRKRAA